MKRFFRCLKGESSRNAGQNPAAEPQVNAASHAPLFHSSPPLPANCGALFSWEAISQASFNFLQERLLGRGNFGEVYRCFFVKTNQAGAAKIQFGTNSDYHREFIAEATTLHVADHPNVIKLLGTCYEPNHRAIVYDLMPNGSLEHYLSANLGPVPGLLNKASVLDWERRMRIAVGVAKGLVYVHMRLKTIHRDIKAANILLDEHFEPRLSDFGLATRIVEGEDGIEQESMMTVMKGTTEYMAPETQRLGKFSTKSDVYSYGVLLLQIFTGIRKDSDFQRPDAIRDLVDWYLSGEVIQVNVDMLVHAAIRNRFSVEGFRSVLHTVRRCVDADPISRPNMDVVEAMVAEAASYPISEASTSSSLT